MNENKKYYEKEYQSEFVDNKRTNEKEKAKSCNEKTFKFTIF